MQLSTPRSCDPPQIHTAEASFGYAGRAVVHDVSLDVLSGETLALLGPNGSGKSTLVKGIIGLVPLLHGEVELFGVPRAQLPDRTRLGYVPQHHTLGASVRSTVREVVATGRLPHRPWWRPASATDRRLVTEAIDAVGLGGRADVDVRTLSGGQQRRVLIARALAGQPEVLIMDEPTAGVDYANQVVLAEVLGELARLGTSMLVVTHELGPLTPVFTRIVCLDRGRVDFDGTPQAWARSGMAHGEGHGAGPRQRSEHAGRPSLLEPDPATPTTTRGT